MEDSRASGPPVDAVLGLSRALAAVAARSLGHLAENLTLAQYWALVELSARGPQTVPDLATNLGVDAAAATKMCEVLARKRLVCRRRSKNGAKGTLVLATLVGRDLVDEVTAVRRAELAGILTGLPPADHSRVLAAFATFASAAGLMPGVWPPLEAAWPPRPPTTSRTEPGVAPPAGASLPPAAIGGATGRRPARRSTSSDLREMH
jgi:DNA-binding MarR family transcriptional regulator